MSDNLLSSGLDLMEKGEFQKALDRISIYLKESPSDPDALCARGMCYFKTGKLRKGRKDIYLAKELGSKAAEEFIFSLKSEEDVDNMKQYDGVSGFLLYFCISCYITGLVYVVIFAPEGDVINFIFGVWYITTGVMLHNKVKYCVANARVVIALSCAMHFLDLISGNPKAMKNIIFCIAWFVYFFVSKRVKVTYGSVPLMPKNLVQSSAGTCGADCFLQVTTEPVKSTEQVCKRKNIDVISHQACEDSSPSIEWLEIYKGSSKSKSLKGCPKCGHEMPVESHFCTICEFGLQENEKKRRKWLPVYKGQIASSDRKMCPICEATMPVSFASCSNCGYTQESKGVPA